MRMATRHAESLRRGDGEQDEHHQPGPSPHCRRPRSTPRPGPRCSLAHRRRVTLSQHARYSDVSGSSTTRIAGLAGPVVRPRPTRGSSRSWPAGAILRASRHPRRRIRPWGRPTDRARGVEASSACDEPHRGPSDATVALAGSATVGQAPHRSGLVGSSSSAYGAEVQVAVGLRAAGQGRCSDAAGSQAPSIGRAARRTLRSADRAARRGGPPFRRPIGDIDFGLSVVRTVDGRTGSAAARDTVLGFEPSWLGGDLLPAWTHAPTGIGRVVLLVGLRRACRHWWNLRLLDGWNEHRPRPSV